VSTVDASERALVAQRARQQLRIWAPGTFLAILQPATARDLLDHSVQRQFPAGRRLLREGAGDTHVELLISGFAKATATVDGIETLLGIRLPGEIIGEISALTGEPRSATVTACGQVIAAVIARSEFEAFLRRHPEATPHVTAMVAKQLRWANRRRTDFGAFPANIRLARLLADIADLCGSTRPDGSVEITVPLSQPELATMIAVAQATVQKAIHELRSLHLINTGYRRLTIVDVGALRAFSGGIG